VELIGVLFMIAVGGAIAVLIMIGIAVAEKNPGPNATPGSAPDRTRIAASVLYHLLIAGGTEVDDALRSLRRVGLLSPITSGIDLANWTERYAQLANAEQRAWLLETAVQLVAAPARPVPLRPCST